MSRFYFHVYDGKVFMDDVGVELADITQARTEALEQCRKLLTKRPGDFWTGEEWRIDVCCPRDVVRFSLKFQATVEAL